MFRSKTLTTGVMSLALLTSLTACGSDSGDDDGGSSLSRAGGSPSPETETDKASRPSAKTLRDVQEFITGAGLPCDNLTEDESANGTPLEGFLGPAEQTINPPEEADPWAIRKAGFCGNTRSDAGGWLIYLPKDMKAFQENYRKIARELAKDDGYTKNLARGKYFFGADFIIDPTNYLASKTLLEAGMLMENCDPSFKAPEGYRTEKALASGCVLTNYLLDPLDQ
ncbi:hypothetical protein [Streptomyces scabiei]|uniref:hypothetical protein n=1 Tax=Streptomyces scabiei TaxID=1930 RepID=UPI0029B22362|nr:hypothetical protein [Streptomyces scabiei]MDX3521356.1 hypothetical protein [Streptomyces scabiei]